MWRGVNPNLIPFKLIPFCRGITLVLQTRLDQFNEVGFTGRLGPVIGRKDAHGLLVFIGCGVVVRAIDPRV